MNQQPDARKPYQWTTPSGHSPIADFFVAIHSLQPAAIQMLDEGTYPVSVAKGKFLIQPQQEDKCLYLLLKGVMRGYIKEDDKEITTWINDENEIVGSAATLGTSTLPVEFVQAIENSTLIAIPYTLIEKLYASFPEANLIGRILLEENYRGAEERAYISRIPSAEKRYRRFIETKPNLVARIPLKFIASYLGMTNETISRIRRQIMHTR